MLRHKPGRAVRRAATNARSQITESVKRQLDALNESESDIEEPTRKLARSSVTEQQRATQSKKKAPEWYIAIDFGTTFTTVAWYRPGMSTENILTIDNFPGENRPHETHNQIATEVWYPKTDTQPTKYVSKGDIRMRFGNEVHRIVELDEVHYVRKIYDASDRVVLMKLLLDKSEYSQASKDNLRKTLQAVKAKGHIKKEEDVIFHFFREIFRALKRLLGYAFKEESTVEVTFCVPVCYDPAAVATIGAQVELAMKAMRFGTDGKSPCSLFVVHEAEAQAMTALKDHSNMLERGGNFVLVDCGGGTTDIGIYRIALVEPLRLGAEVHEAIGAMVGSADLNSRFRKVVKRILRKERYLEARGDTIDDIISSELMFKFEHKTKREFQYGDTRAQYIFKIYDLKTSESDPRIVDRHLVLTYDEMWNIFRPSVTKIGEMMVDAVQKAHDAGYGISKIVVVGGFADSPCLQQYLIEQKDRTARDLGAPLELCFPKPGQSATGVATGAILRAINKADGPSRVPCQSIGIIRHIPCNSDNDEYTDDILAQEKTYSDAEGTDYIWNTIHWLVKKDGPMLKSIHKVTFNSEHIFKTQDVEWIIEEQLWASQTCTLDHWKIDHENNAGKVMEIGAVEFDISDMRSQIRAANRKNGEMVNKVVIQVEMTVIDRNLEFTARWPTSSGGRVIQGSRKFFNVASAFTPGTQ